jgi:uncharacterized RDD family membrane protein YckC
MSDKQIDSTIEAQTPEGIAFVLYPAGVPVRACAYGIDVFVQWAIMFGVLLGVGILQEGMGEWLILLLMFAVDWFYHIASELLFRGQSLGKRVMGLRVVLSDGSPVNASASFMRNLLRFADVFMYWYLLVLLTMSFSPGFRRLGDWAADTLVVYTVHSRNQARRLKQAWLEKITPVSTPRPLSYEEKQAIVLFAKRYPLLGGSLADEIAHEYVSSLIESGGGGTLPDGVSDAAYLLSIARNYMDAV